MSVPEISDCKTEQNILFSRAISFTINITRLFHLLIIMLIYFDRYRVIVLL